MSRAALGFLLASLLILRLCQCTGSKKYFLHIHLVERHTAHCLLWSAHTELPGTDKADTTPHHSLIKVCMLGTQPTLEDRVMIFYSLFSHGHLPQFWTILIPSFIILLPFPPDIPNTHLHSQGPGLLFEIPQQLRRGTLLDVLLLLVREARSLRLVCCLTVYSRQEDSLYI